MSIITNDMLTPRESILMEAEKEENRLSREHALQMQKLAIELKKTEIKLRQEDATKSRKHQEQMKQVELAIREQEVKWQNLLKIPLLIIRLPILTILTIGYIIDRVKKTEPSDKFWQLMK